MVNKINETEIKIIKDRSVYSLPDNPSAQDYTATQIKEAMFNFVTDSQGNSISASINRIVGEINDGLESQDMALLTHERKQNNPHNVSKTQVGLGSVDNTSDLSKPLSLANTTALNLKTDRTYTDSELAKKLDKTSRATVNGVASLDANGLVPLSQIPPQAKEMTVVGTIADRNNLPNKFSGLFVFVKDATADLSVKSGGATYIYDGAFWSKTSEAESMDVIVKWADLQGIPTKIDNLPENTVAEINILTENFQQIVAQETNILPTVDGDSMVGAPSQKAVNDKFMSLTKSLLPIHQQSEVVHLEGTSAGYVDKLVMSSEPRQVVSPNLIKYPYVQNSSTVDGITFLVNADYSVTVSGVPTNFAIFRLCTITLPIGTYYKSGNIQGKCSVVYKNVNPQEGEPQYLEPTIMTLTRAMLLDVYLQVNPSFIPNNITIYPMLNEGATALSYQPYTGQPSPENPIAIDVVKSPVEIVSRGKNIEKNPTGHIEFTNFYYRDYKVKPNFILKPNTKYSVSFDYIINSTSTSAGFETSCGYGGINFLRILRTFRMPDKTMQQLIHMSYSFITPEAFDASLGIPFLWLRVIMVATVGALNCDYSNLMVCEGEVSEYIPYNGATTSLPLLTAPTKDKPSVEVELLGEYNTETNILEQKWKKLVLNGSESFNFIGLTTSGHYCYRYDSNIFPSSGNTKLSFCNRFKATPEIGYREYINMTADEFKIQNYAIYIVAYLATVAEFKALLEVINPTVYYQLATPEVLTMTPLTAEQTPKTLDGETNIYAVNNASPITFDVTELLVNRERENIVLEDKDNYALMPFTVASQVEVDTITGTTLDMELESIEASITTEKIDRETEDNEIRTELSAEITARTNGDMEIIADLSEEITDRIGGDAAIRIGLGDGSLIPNRSDGLVGEKILTNTAIEVTGEGYGIKVISGLGTLSSLGDMLILKGNVEIIDIITPTDYSEFKNISGLYISSSNDSLDSHISIKATGRNMTITAYGESGKTMKYTIDSINKIKFY